MRHGLLKDSDPGHSQVKSVMDTLGGGYGYLNILITCLLMGWVRYYFIGIVLLNFFI